MKPYLIGGLAILLTGLSLAAAAPTQAAQAGTRIVERMTPGMIASSLKETGYDTVVEEDNQGDPMIIARSGDFSFAVLFFGCSKSGTMPDRFCTDLEFYASFNLEEPPALVALNRWNAGQAYGKAYLRNDRKVVFEMPVNLAKGVSESFLQSSLEWWFSALTAFDEEVLTQ